MSPATPASSTRRSHPLRPELHARGSNRFFQPLFRTTRHRLRHCVAWLKSKSPVGVPVIPLFGSGTEMDEPRRRIGRARARWDGSPSTRLFIVWRRWLMFRGSRTLYDVAESLNSACGVVDRDGWMQLVSTRPISTTAHPLGSAGNTNAASDSSRIPERNPGAASLGPRKGCDGRGFTTYLVRPRGRLVRSFTHRHSITPSDPGYVRAYPPVIMENGGLYARLAVVRHCVFRCLVTATSGRTVSRC